MKQERFRLDLKRNFGHEGRQAAEQAAWGDLQSPSSEVFKPRVTCSNPVGDPAVSGRLDQRLPELSCAPQVRAVGRWGEVARRLLCRAHIPVPVHGQALNKDSGFAGCYNCSALYQPLCVLRALTYQFSGDGPFLISSPAELLSAHLFCGRLVGGELSSEQVMSDGLFRAKHQTWSAFQKKHLQVPL